MLVATLLNEKDRKNTQKSYMWVFKGYVQSDGYAGYNFVAADKYMYQLYCMAHARRKFMEHGGLNKAYSVLSKTMVQSEYQSILTKDLLPIEEE